MVGVVGVAFVVWISGLGFVAAGLALDHPPCIRSHEPCDSVTSSWSWTPPGTRYEWIDADGEVRSATDPWAFSATDSWAWTAIVAVLTAAAIFAITRRDRSSMSRRWSARG